MRTYLDCIPCFFRQALDAARMAGVNEAGQKRILDELSKLIKKIPLTASPPEIGRSVYKLVAKVSGKSDPFKKIKRTSNRSALKLYPRLRKTVNSSRDRLLTAIELAIAGNVIDYGVKSSLDINREMKKIYEEDLEFIKRESRAVFDYRQFRNTLKRTDAILYLADNAGEVVFDRILIEELVREEGKRVVYVVKGAPVINDALTEDAFACGIGDYAQIVSSGSDAPGTVLRFCSREFLALYESSKMIISKGQGNFEALSEENRPIFFLFKVKCPVVAGDIGANLGDVVLQSGFKCSAQRVE